MAVTQVRARDLVHKAALWSTSGVLAGVPAGLLLGSWLQEVPLGHHIGRETVSLCVTGASVLRANR